MSKGHGISSLLKDSHLVLPESFRGIQKIPVSSIVENKFQPRKLFSQQALNELAESIKVHGIIQPLTVRVSGPNTYELIAGERRWRASQLAGLEEVPVFIRNVEDEKSLELALLENLKREDLNPLEVAWAYKRMMEECSYNQEQMAARVGKNRATVSNFLRLLTLTEEVQKALIRKDINMGQARPLIPVEDKDFQAYLLEKILSEELNSRQVEQLVKKGKPGTLSPIERIKEDYRLEEKEINKTSIFPIKIKAKNLDKGMIEVRLKNVAELEALKDFLR